MTRQSRAVQLTRALRRELLAIDGVSETLLEELWPSVQFIADQRQHNSGALLNDVLRLNREANLQGAESADLVHRVAMDAAASGIIARALFAAYGFDRESFDKASAFLAALAAESAQSARVHRAIAKCNAPKPGRAAEVDWHERLLISELERVWTSAHGRRPAVSENSPFIAFAAKVGYACGLDVTRSKVRTALGRIGAGKSKVMRPSKVRATRQ
jgi:hypothetical protein